MTKKNILYIFLITAFLVLLFSGSVNGDYCIFGFTVIHVLIGVITDLQMARRQFNGEMLVSTTHSDLLANCIFSAVLVSAGLLIYQLVFKAFLWHLFYWLIAIVFLCFIARYFILRNKTVPQFILTSDALLVNDIWLHTYQLNAIQSLELDSYTNVYEIHSTSLLPVRIKGGRFNEDAIKSFMKLLAERTGLSIHDVNIPAEGQPISG